MKAPKIAGLIVLVAALAVTLSMLPSKTAEAGRSSVRTIQFLAWSGVNPDTYAIKVVDPNKGNRLEVRQIGNPIPMVKVKVKPDNEKTVFNSQQFAAWSFIVPGSPGLTAPNGWQVFGQGAGQLLRIGLSNGRDSMELGRVQARSDTGSGTFAKTTVKNAFWSPDSTRVVVIVNQRNSVSGFNLNIDEPHAFKIGK